MEFAQPEGYEASTPAGMCDLGSPRQNLQFDIFPAATSVMALRRHRLRDLAS